MYERQHTQEIWEGNDMGYKGRLHGQTLVLPPFILLQNKLLNITGNL